MGPAVLFCGIAMALGWGIRGEIGGSTGASIPGALFGVALALGSGREDWIRKAAYFGAAGALGFALGGQMSYGVVIGYTFGIDMVNVGYGFAMLGVIGGLWGAFAAGALGMVASEERYPLWQVVLFVVAGFLGGELVHFVLVDSLGVRMTPPRGDAWANSLGACLVMAMFFAIRRDALPARFMVWGLMAGSLGFIVGDAFQVIGTSVGPPYDWWKVMEQTFGLVLGVGLSYGIYRESSEAAELEVPEPFPSTLGLAIAALMVPGTELLDAFDRWGEFESFDMSGSPVNPVPHFAMRGVAVAALAVVLLILRHREVDYSEPEGRRAQALFLWLVWACSLIALAKVGYPELSASHARVHVGFLVMACILTVWCVLPFRSFEAWADEKPRLAVWTPAYGVVAAATILVVAWLSIASHGGEWVHNAHKRFGDEPAEAAPTE